MNDKQQYKLKAREKKQKGEEEKGERNGKDRNGFTIVNTGQKLTKR